MSILPARVMTMARTAFADSLPPRKRQKPRATQMTSVHTMVVELATEVWRRDSNQSTMLMCGKVTHKNLNRQQPIIPKKS